MKIVCESCGTKYSIADEKVSGKVFKLRCKKCSHVIVVKGTGEGEAPQEAQPPAAAEQEPVAEAPGAASAPEAVWHLVIDREQVGPMTPEEVRAKFAAGQVDAESYIWREGFDDWLKLASVDDFRDLGAQQRPGTDDQATRRSDSADLFRNASREEEPAPAADLFGSGAAAAHGGKTATPNANTIMASSPMTSPFASSSASAPASSGEAIGSSSPVEVKAMTGARSENSVLFSLSNLQALASGGGGGGGGSAPSSSAGPKPGYSSSQSEGSGLIDIRAMAAQTLSANSFSMGNASKADELPAVNEAPLFSPVGPAVLMPISEPSGMPKWVWAVVGVGGAMVVGMIVVIVWVLGAQPPPAQPTAQPAGPVVAAGGEAPKSPGQPGAQPAAPSGGPAAKPGKPPGKESEPVAAAGEGDKKRRSRDKDKDKSAPKGPAPKEAAVAAAPEPAVEAPKKPAKSNKPKDDLDALLDNATGGSGSGKPKGDAAKKDAPEQLSMDVIKSGLKSVNGTVQACNQGSAGTYIVKMTIGKSGRVSDASVPGKAGDATADCVVRAVKGARFPEFTGDPQSLSYPFILR